MIMKATETRPQTKMIALRILVTAEGRVVSLPPQPCAALTSLEILGLPQISFAAYVDGAVISVVAPANINTRAGMNLNIFFIDLL